MEREQRFAREEALHAEVCSTPATAPDIPCVLQFMIVYNNGPMHLLADQKAGACI